MGLNLNPIIPMPFLGPEHDTRTAKQIDDDVRAYCEKRRAGSIGAEVQRNEAERIRVDEMAARRNASVIRKDGSGYLVTSPSVEATDLKPTCELRWLHPAPLDTHGLQQRWACALTGKSEWRDVPVVMEGEQ